MAGANAGANVGTRLAAGFSPFGVGTKAAGHSIRGSVYLVPISP